MRSILYKGKLSAFFDPSDEQTLVVTSPYGQRVHPVTKENSFHTGIDVIGGTNIIVPLPDEVEWSYDEINGNRVVLKYDKTAYILAHLRNVIMLPLSEKELFVGQVGNSGRGTGKHLHIEKWKNQVNLSKDMTLAEISLFFRR